MCGRCRRFEELIYIRHKYFSGLLMTQPICCPLCCNVFLWVLQYIIDVYQFMKGLHDCVLRCLRLSARARVCVCVCVCVGVICSISIKSRHCVSRGWCQFEPSYKLETII